LGHRPNNRFRHPSEDFSYAKPAHIKPASSR
jgi:hypothetical protein